MNTKTWNDLAEVENATAAATNLLLIDANNLAFRWLQRKNVDNFTDDFTRTIESLGKSYRARRIIVCFDFGRSYYRNDLLDTYKANRKKPTDPETVEKFDKFFSCLNVIPDLIPFENYKFRGIEADDIIAYLCNNISPSYEHTWLVSSDRDLFQLINNEVSIFNMFSRKEITIDTLIEDYQVTPEEYMLSRILEGDKSDNILGVEGIGPKRAQTLAREYKTLDNLIESLPIKPAKAKFLKNLNDSKEILLRNEKLITLKKHNELAITAGKHGQEAWEELQGVSTS